jgi:5-oxoprolinase (ATP-hydrolysing) subunit A
MRYVDLNCDMGELPEALSDGSQEQLMRYITSVNIACGGHAGNVQMMRSTIEQALKHGVAIGAHPGYEDRANFGRVELRLSKDEISNSVHRQILSLHEIAGDCAAAIGHVKAHGALYNQAARNREIARAIVEGVRRWRTDVVLVGLAGSVMLEEFRTAGSPVAAEAFADRRYESDGSLRSRKFDDSLLSDPADAAAQALCIVEQGTALAAGGAVVPVQAQTLCIHGDTPGAVQIAAAVRRRLMESGVTLRCLEKTP